MIICIDGIDGIGKSSICASLKIILERELKKSVYILHEPSDIGFSDNIYKIFKESINETESELTRFFLVNASRSELFKDDYVKDLSHNGIVILDRYIPSTLVYQGYSQAIFFLEEIYNISLKASGRVIPDYTFILTDNYSKIRDKMKNRNLSDVLDLYSIKVLCNRYKNSYDFLLKMNWPNLHLFSCMDRVLDKILDIIKN